MRIESGGCVFLQCVATLLVLMLSPVGAGASDAFPWSSGDELWWNTDPAATPTVNATILTNTTLTVQAGEGVCGWVYLPTDSAITGIELRLQKNGDQWLQAHWGTHTPNGVSAYMGSVPPADASWHKLVVDLSDGLTSPVNAGDTISGTSWAAFAGDKLTKVWWNNCIADEDEIGPVIDFPNGNPHIVDTHATVDTTALYSCSDNKDPTCASVSVTIDDTELMNSIGQPGSYPVTYTATDSDGNTTVAMLEVTIELAYPGPPLVYGRINHDTWSISGNGRDINHLVQNANFPQTPASAQALDVSSTGLQTGSTPGKQGQRLSGYLVPDENGPHKFWIASSDESQLWLSTDDDPANATKIAEVRSWGAGWTSQYDWNKYGAQDSSPISLNAGQRYYFELRHVASGSGRRAEVAWRGPSGGGNPPEDASWVIPGANLALHQDSGPSVNLNGSATVTQAADYEYIETATCVDAIEGACSSFDIDYGTLTNLNVPPIGVHTVTYTGVDSVGNSTQVTRTVEVKNFAIGSITRNLILESGNGKQVDNVLNHQQYPNNPDITDQIQSFHSYQSRFKFGQFLRGYVIAPETGDYTFWISSNDSSRLFISSNANKSNKIARAEVPGSNATADFEWTKYSQQKSSTVSMVAGQAYFIEAVHQRRWSNGDVAVAWRMPSDTTNPANDGSRLVPGSSLAPE